jgi:hypothetical protein
MRVLEIIAVTWLMFMFISPSTVGKSAHSIWNEVVAGWEQVRP